MRPEHEEEDEGGAALHRHRYLGTYVYTLGTQMLPVEPVELVDVYDSPSFMNPLKRELRTKNENMEQMMRMR